MEMPFVRLGVDCVFLFLVPAPTSILPNPHQQSHPMRQVGRNPGWALLLFLFRGLNHQRSANLGTIELGAAAAAR